MKKIFMWLIATCLLQLGVYFYLDRVILAPAASFSQKTVEEENSSSALKYSYDGSYYAQLVDKGLEIYDSKTKTVAKEIKLEDNQNITYFTWLPERNIALAGIAETSKSSGTVILEPINPETASEPVAPKVSGLSPGAEIVDVAFSTKTNVIHMLVKKGNYTAIYRTDANNNLQDVRANTTRIRKIASLSHEDILFYDNIRNGSVYAIDNEGKYQEISPAEGKYSLIGVDKDDNIYIGKLEDSEKYVTSVLIGKYNGIFTEFKTLANPYPADSISVTYDGKIILN